MGEHQISFALHNFKKKNLITIIKKKQVYDLYECSDCGLKGKRFGLDNFLTCTINKVCSKTKINSLLGKKVLITDPSVINSFGFAPKEEYEIVCCPERFMGHYKNDVWVYSEKRNEPVRLLSGEYTLMSK